jgi:hypothetical protein
LLIGLFVLVAVGLIGYACCGSRVAGKLFDAFFDPNGVDASMEYQIERDLAKQERWEKKENG